jgi:hypothetical protein
MDSSVLKDNDILLGVRQERVLKSIFAVTETEFGWQLIREV